MSNYNAAEENAILKSQIEEKVRWMKAQEQQKFADSCCNATARAQNVHDVIDQRLSDLRLELNQLDALRRQLPQEMNLPAQEALINLIRNRRA